MTPSQKKSVTSRFSYSFLSVLLILIGFGLIFASSIDFVKSNMILTAKAGEKDLGAQNQVTAEKIYIPAMNRTLNVSDGFVVDDRWTVSETGVSHLTTSAVPGRSGNAVLYGHNKEGVLAKLWKVQKDDLVYVILSNGSISKYKIFERKEVKPDGVQILDDVGDSRLTLYTCSGFLDSARYVIVGELI